MGDLFVTDGNGRYMIRRQTLAGAARYSMERPFVPVRIPDDVRDEAIDDFRPAGFTAEQGFSRNDVPVYYAPFEDFFVGDDGRTWVRRKVAGDMMVLDIFSAEGQFIGSADLPDDFDRMIIQRVVGNHMYGLVWDALEVSYVVRLVIQEP